MLTERSASFWKNNALIYTKMDLKSIIFIRLENLELDGKVLSFVAQVYATGALLRVSLSSSCFPSLGWGSSEWSCWLDLQSHFLPNNNHCEWFLTVTVNNKSVHPSLSNTLLLHLDRDILNGHENKQKCLKSIWEVCCQCPSAYYATIESESAECFLAVMNPQPPGGCTKWLPLNLAASAWNDLYSSNEELFNNKRFFLIPEQSNVACFPGSKLDKNRTFSSSTLFLERM